MKIEPRAKTKCYMMVYKAVKNGFLKRPECCSKCGGSILKIHAHIMIIINRSMFFGYVILVMQNCILQKKPFYFQIKNL